MPGTPASACYRHPGREAYIRCQRCEKIICPDCMHGAAVGFHCPDCVAEARRTTRSARTAYGGVRPTNPGLTTITLIGINVFVWVLILVTGWRSSPLIERLALTPEGLCWTADHSGYFPSATEQTCSVVNGGTWVPGVADGAPWQLLTSAFTHVDILHIAFNMLALYVLGPQLELILGRWRFLALYLLSALAGSAMVLWFADERSATLGASGAVFGLMGALLVVAFKVGGNVQSILTWIGINVLITVAGASFISWQGHLGGFLGGLAVAVTLVYAPREHRTRFQVAALAGVALVIAVAVLARIAVLA